MYFKSISRNDYAKDIITFLVAICAAFEVAKAITASPRSVRYFYCLATS
jgi:hypothetical protein